MIAARIMSVYCRPTPLELVNGLAPFAPQTLVDDQGFGPWWNARRCWLSGIESGAEHVLVIQDDAALVPGFCELALEAIAARPRAVISFFYHEPRASVAAGDAPWIDFPILNWGVALCLPSKWAQDCVEWNDLNIMPSQKADDLRVLTWACNMGLPVSCTNPSIVEHRPEFASTVSPRPDNREFMASRIHRGEKIDWAQPPYKAPGDIRAFLISRQHHKATA